MIKDIVRLIGLLTGLMLICYVFFEYMISREVPDWMLLLSSVSMSLIITIIVVLIAKQIKKLLNL